MQIVHETSWICWLNLIRAFPIFSIEMFWHQTKFYLKIWYFQLLLSYFLLIWNFMMFRIFLSCYIEKSSLSRFIACKSSKSFPPTKALAKSQKNISKRWKVASLKINYSFPSMDEARAIVIAEDYKLFRSVHQQNDKRFITRTVVFLCSLYKILIETNHNFLNVSRSCKHFYCKCLLQIRKRWKLKTISSLFHNVLP